VEGEVTVDYPAIIERKNKVGDFLGERNPLSAG
jgi:hypothetical protein